MPSEQRDDDRRADEVRCDQHDFGCEVVRESDGRYERQHCQRDGGDEESRALSQGDCQPDADGGAEHRQLRESGDGNGFAIGARDDRLAAAALEPVPRLAFVYEEALRWLPQQQGVVESFRT